MKTLFCYLTLIFLISSCMGFGIIPIPEQFNIVTDIKPNNGTIIYENQVLQVSAAGTTFKGDASTITQYKWGIYHSETSNLILASDFIPVMPKAVSTSIDVEISPYEVITQTPVCTFPKLPGVMTDKNLLVKLEVTSNTQQTSQKFFGFVLKDTNGKPSSTLTAKLSGPVNILIDTPPFKELSDEWGNLIIPQNFYYSIYLTLTNIKLDPDNLTPENSNLPLNYGGKDTFASFWFQTYKNGNLISTNDPLYLGFGQADRKVSSMEIAPGTTSFQISSTIWDKKPKEFYFKGGIQDSGGLQSIDNTIIPVNEKSLTDEFVTIKVNQNPIPKITVYGLDSENKAREQSIIRLDALGITKEGKTITINDVPYNFAPGSSLDSDDTQLYYKWTVSPNLYASNRFTEMPLTTFSDFTEDFTRISKVNTFTTESQYFISIPRFKETIRQDWATLPEANNNLRIVPQSSITFKPFAIYKPYIKVRLEIVDKTLKHYYVDNNLVPLGRAVNIQRSNSIIAYSEIMIPLTINPDNLNSIANGLSTETNQLNALSFETQIPADRIQTYDKQRIIISNNLFLGPNATAITSIGMYADSLNTGVMNYQTDEDPATFKSDLEFPIRTFGPVIRSKLMFPKDGKIHSLVLSFDAPISTEFGVLKRSKDAANKDIWLNYELDYQNQKRVIWTKDRKKVIIYLKDGDRNWGDYDGIVDGIITDPVILGVPGTGATMDSVESRSKCFINSLNY